MLTVIVASYLYDNSSLSTTLNSYLKAFLGEPDRTLKGSYLIGGKTRKCKCVHVDYVYDWVQFIVAGKEIILDTRMRQDVFRITADFVMTIYHEVDMPSPWSRVLDEAQKFGLPTDNLIILLFLQESVGLILTRNEYMKLGAELKKQFVDLGHELLKDKREKILSMIKGEYREFRAMVRIEDIGSSIENLKDHKQALLLNPDKYWEEIRKVDKLIEALKDLREGCLRLKTNTYIHRELAKSIEEIYPSIFFHKEWSDLGAQLVDFLKYKYEESTEEEEILI